MSTEMTGRMDAILIAGPTASGKSDLAVRLARAFGGAVVNADSMQVYGDLSRLTARPTPAEMGEVPHHLYGTVDGAVNFSVGHYLRAARSVLEDIAGRNLIPIVVGGTGLYFKALTDGLSDLPDVPDHIRAAVRHDGEDLATPDLHVRLMACDPATAGRLRPSDRQRILRALEIHAATGLSLSLLQTSRIEGPLAGRRLVRLFLTPDREALRARIDRRFVAMIEGGALDEVGALARRRLDPALPVMRAHGVPGLIRHLDGELSLADAIQRGQADTRRYVKRQWTWGRHQMAGFSFVAPETAFETATSLVRDART